MSFPFLQVIQSFLFGKIIERSASQINPVLEVRLVNNRLLLDSDHANYSYGSLHTIFQKAFRQLNLDKKKIKNVLILGFGAGSVASILIDELKMKCHITGVESDPEILRLAAKYFNTGRFTKIKLLTSDAVEFMHKNDHRFDLVVVDIYLDKYVPGECEDVDFLKDINESLKPDGLMLFNKMICDASARKTADELLHKVESIFKEINVLRIRARSENWIIVAIRKEIQDQHIN